jgi:hypothetical protein
VDWYRRQASGYAGLLRSVHRLERRALGYWAWREGGAFAMVTEAVQAASKLGLPASAGQIPACGTPACFRGAVARQEEYAAWLNETANTLQVYGQAIFNAPDPAVAAAMEAQKAHALAAVGRARGKIPIPLTAVDRLIATSASPEDEARAGALAHLDADALERNLLHDLPPRAIVVSVEDERISWYARGKTVQSGTVTAGPSAPAGVFHIQAKELAISATYWRRLGATYRYLPGSLPDWMPFSGDAALQAAPWRTAFGPGSEGAMAAFAPDTPGSIDLPPAAADALFRWATVGTEVVVY